MYWVWKLVEVAIPAEGSILLLDFCSSIGAVGISANSGHLYTHIAYGRCIHVGPSLGIVRLPVWTSPSCIMGVFCPMTAMGTVSVYRHSCLVSIHI